MSTQVPADKIGFFLGAGASIELGIPSMTSITREFFDELEKEQGTEKRILSDIYAILQGIYGKRKVDLEAVMSTIEGLKEREHFRENIGEFGAFFLKEDGIVRAQKHLKEYDPRILQKLERSFKEFTRQRVRLYRLGINHLRNVYDSFFSRLHDVTTSNAGSGPNTHAHRTWTFFTTNYDNAIEEYWVKYRR